MKIAVTVSALLGLSLSFAQAANYSWTSVGSSSWSASTSWTPNGTPGSGDNIVSLGSSNLLVDGTSRTVNSFLVNNSSNNSNIIGNSGINGTTLTITGTISKAGTAQLVFRDSASNPLTVNVNNVDVQGGSLLLGLNGVTLTGFTATNATVGNGLLQFFMVDGGTATVQSLTLIDAAAVVNLRSSGGSGGSSTATGTSSLVVDSLNGTVGTVRVTGSATGGAVRGNLVIASTGSSSYSGQIVDRGSGSNGVLAVIKSGAGTQSLGGNNAYTGGTTVSAGTLILAHNNAAGTGSVTVNGGKLQIQGGVTVGNTVAFGAAGGTIKGNGTLGNAITLNNTNQVLAPGASVGILNLAASENWSSFTYQWELNNWSGTSAGTDFDRLAIAGSLDLTGGAPLSYVLDITSLTLSNVAGDVGNFTDTSNSWTILTTTTGITGFDSANWNLLTSNFDSALPATGSWSLTLTNSGRDLTLVYAVPEPTTWALIGAGFFLLLARRARGLSKV